jgi:hypothetical protein
MGVSQPPGPVAMRAGDGISLSGIESNSESFI